MIEAEGLVKSFGHVLAVQGLSLSIEAGEIFGLLGPNGAGKTTTINMLVGLLAPDSGHVTIGPGRSGVGGQPTDAQARRLIGVAPQALALYDDLTAEENLAFFGRLYGMGRKRLRDRIDWALEFAGLQSRRRGRVSTYSGGMKRRLNLAAALLHEPEIVILDEPTVGIDPQSRNHLFECIERLHADGLTILYTTHYMEEAQRLCDRVAIIDEGRLLDVDTVPGLIEKHGALPVIEGQLAKTFNHPFENAEITGMHFRMETAEPVSALARAAEAGLEFQSVTIHQPDLESVFLALTGKRLRDS